MTDASNETKDCVHSVMGSQHVNRVGIPFIGSSKMHRSEPSNIDIDIDSVVKKWRVNAKAYNNLYNSQEQPRSIVVTTAGVHVDANPSVEQRI